MTDLREVHDCGTTYWVDRQGNVYHQCPKCIDNLVSEDYMEEHDDCCEDCYNRTHQCEYCGDVSEAEVEPAGDGMRYCDKCQTELLNKLFEDMKSIKSTAAIFNIVTAKVGKHGDSYLHLTDDAFGQIKELMEWDTQTKPYIDGYNQESIIIDGIEVMCMHKVEAVKEQELKEAV